MQVYQAVHVPCTAFFVRVFKRCHPPPVNCCLHVAIRRQTVEGGRKRYPLFARSNGAAFRKLLIPMQANYGDGFLRTVPPTVCSLPLSRSHPSPDGGRVWPPLFAGSIPAIQTVPPPMSQNKQCKTNSGWHRSLNSGWHSRSLRGISWSVFLAEQYASPTLN